MFIKNKTKVPCRMSGIDKKLSILESCCLRPIMRNSVLVLEEHQDLRTSSRKSVAGRSGGGR